MPSKKWWKISEIYKKSAPETINVSFSDEMAQEMFLFESTGKGSISKENGYALGKKWMDVQIAQWKQDIDKGLLFPFELLAFLPDWFLIKAELIFPQYDKEYAKEFLQKVVE